MGERARDLDDRALVHTGACLGAIKGDGTHTIPGPNVGGRGGAAHRCARQQPHTSWLVRPGTISRPTKLTLTALAPISTSLLKPRL